MVKENIYAFRLERKEFYQLVEKLGIDKFEIEVISSTYYDKQNYEFSSPNFPYESLILIQTKKGEYEETNLNYEHCYPENECYHNDIRHYQTKVEDIEAIKVILKAIGMITIGQKDEKHMITKSLLENYKMTLKIIDENYFEIEFNAVDHYITKEDYMKISKYLLQYDIIHKEICFD